MRNVFFRVGLAALLLVSCMPFVQLEAEASKVEEAPIETTAEIMAGEIWADTLSLSSVFPDGVPVCTLSFAPEDENISFHALCVRDEQQRLWLVSSAEAGEYAKNGASAVVTGATFSGATEYLGMSGMTAFFSVPEGDESASCRIGSAGRYVQVLNCETAGAESLSEPMAMADFEKYEGYYLLPYSSNTGFSVGSPVLNCENGRVCGLVSKANSGAMMIIDLSEITFPEITDDTAVQQEEPAQRQETAEEKSEGTIVYIGIGAAAAVLAVLAVICKKKRKPEEKAAEEVQKEAFCQPDKKPASNDMLVCKPWQIRCIRGPRMGEIFTLQDRIVIGRVGEANVVFPEGTAGVSRKHCALVAAGHRVFLQDLNSTYGTYIGEAAAERLQPEEKRELQCADVFALSQRGPMFRLEHPCENGEHIGFGVRSGTGSCYQPDACGVVTFGRNSICTVRFERDNTVISTSHCKLFAEGQDLYLMDLGSTNGTFLQDHSRLIPHKKYPVTCGTVFYLSAPPHSFTVTEG